ncbi:MAG: hypothetical protein HGA90_07675 [Alphaproteobacteria bacterium]|nr:hypothetical protein [Alphaproteobacteria bacterium]
MSDLKPLPTLLRNFLKREIDEKQLAKHIVCHMTTENGSLAKALELLYPLALVYLAANPDRRAACLRESSTYHWPTVFHMRLKYAKSAMRLVKADFRDRTAFFLAAKTLYDFQERRNSVKLVEQMAKTFAEKTDMWEKFLRVLTAQENLKRAAESTFVRTKGQPDQSGCIVIVLGERDMLRGRPEKLRRGDLPERPPREEVSSRRSAAPARDRKP